MNATTAISILLFLGCSMFCWSYKDFSTYPRHFDEIKKHFKTDRPTIGVLSMTNNDKKLFQNVPNTDDTSYVAASYVKLVESAGGRAVALMADMPVKDLQDVLHSINGVILSGGDGELANSDYEKVSRMVYEYSMEKYDKEGEIWPVLGICRGSQILPVFTVARDFLVHTMSKNYSIPLQLTEEWKESRLLGNASEGIVETLRNKPITINAHLFSIPTKFFMETPELYNFYRPISRNKDRDGIDFISTFEARRYPLYGLQWHPEKLSYVWNPVMVADHSLDSVRVTQYIANFFVMEAKRNSNRFRSREMEEKHLVYRWQPVYVGDIKDAPYEQVYVFPLFE
eukprot:gene5429-6108_t